MTREKRHTWESPTRLREDWPTMPRSSILFRNSIANSFRGLTRPSVRARFRFPAGTKVGEKPSESRRKRASGVHLLMILAQIVRFLPCGDKKKAAVRNNSCRAGFPLFQRIVKTRAIFLAILGITPRKGHLHAVKRGRL